MATSSFYKEFKLGKEKEDEFVEVMTQKGASTLPEDFNSQHVSVKDHRELLRKALSPVKTEENK